MKKLLILLLLLTTPANAGVLSVEIKDDKNKETATVNNSALDINVSDQTSESISLYLAEHLATDLSLPIDLVSGDLTIQILSPTVVPAIGNFICIKDIVNFAQIEITSVFADGGGLYTIDISMPIDYPFTISSKVCLQNVDMNINGNLGEVEFSVSPIDLQAGTEWHINRMIVSMTHGSLGDDGLFGSIPALGNGVYFRVGNGNSKNLFNAKENADFANEGYDITYSVRSGGLGTYGTRTRKTWNGQDKSGVALPLSTDNLDKFKAIIRDDLTLLSRLRIKVQGHVVD